jgi:carbohydrate-selective porin OprB
LEPEAIQDPPAVVQPAPSLQLPGLQPEAERPRVVVPGSPDLDRRLLDEPLPWRRRLSEQGIDALVLATMDLSKVSGGIGSPTIGQALIDVAVTANLDRLGVVPGAEVFASLQWWDWFGDSPTQVGDWWGWDAINPAIGEEIFQLSELWWQQTIADGALVIMLGKIDANRMFATVPNAGPFLNTADSMPATMLVFMPTYPNPAMGAVVSWSGLDDEGLRGWSARAGVFDGSNAAYDPETGQNGPRTGNRGPAGMFDGHWGPYWIAQGGPAWTVGEQSWAGTFTVGGWFQGGQTLLTAGNAGAIADDAGGLFATLTHAMHAPDDEGSRWDAFAQFGWSSASSEAADLSLAVGAICSAPLPGRPNDQWGVLAGVTEFADDPAVYVNRLGSTGRQESVLEAFYLIALPHGISLQPDLQWIGTPGGGDGATVDDALIGTIRIQIAF